MSSSSSSLQKQRLIAAILNFLANDKEADADSLGIASQIISDTYNINTSSSSELNLPPQHTLLDVFNAGINSLNITYPEKEEKLEDNPKYQQFIKQLEEMGYFKDCSEEQRLVRVEKAKEKFLARTQAAKPDTATAEQFKNEGNEYLKKRQFKEAIESYKNAIKSDPTNPIYPANMGAAYMQLGDFESAEKCCKKAVELDPKYSKAHGRLGQIYQRLGKSSDAIKHFELGLELDPTNEEYRKKLDSLKNPSTTATRSANPSPFGGGLGGLGGLGGGGGLGGLSNLLGGLGGGSGGGGGMGGLGEMLNNPEFMRMAMDMMQKPEMQQMMQGVMQNMMGGQGAQESDDQAPRGGSPFGGIDESQIDQVLEEPEVRNSEKLTSVFNECKQNGINALWNYMGDPEVSSFMQSYAMKKMSSLPADQNPFSFLQNRNNQDDSDQNDDNNSGMYS
jgi:tetratricopeptide (TPR) repeat protein